jgi:hypothetical protein
MGTPCLNGMVPSDGHLGLENCIAGMAKFGHPCYLLMATTFFFFFLQQILSSKFFQEKNWEIFGKKFSSVNLTEFLMFGKKNCQFDGPTKDQGFYYEYYYYYYFNFIR